MGCLCHGADSPKTSALSHASQEVMIVGETARQVIERWGNPQARLTKDFRQLKYKRPKKLPAFDEQIVYLMPELIGHRIVYLKGGVAVLCVEEWSDF
jgi:hypothetical protein